MSSRGVNKVILVGVLGQDPELKYTQSGTAVCRLSLATSEVWKDKNSGENQEKTEWHRIVVWAKPAEIIAEYARKGSKLYIEGKLETRKWERDGQTHYTTEIRADQFQFLSEAKGGGGSSNKQRQAPASAPQQSGFEDDDIPF